MRNEATGWVRRERDIVGEQRMRDLDRVSPYWVREKPGVRKMPKNLQKRPQLRLVVIAEMDPKLLLSFSKR